MSKFLDTDGLSYFWSKLKSKFDDLASKISSNTSNISTMSSKLSGIESGANKYTLPTASSSTLGGIKVGSNLTINDGVLSGTPNTTYSDATTSAHGLMSASDKTKVNNIDKNYRLSVGLVGHKIIPNNANLNTLDYIKVDSYRIVSNASAATLTNCPVSIAFRMDVYNAVGSGNYDDESTNPWVYRYREITTYTGEKWKQLVYSGNTAGQFVYDQWMKIRGDKGCEFELGFDSSEDLVLVQHEY